MHAYKIRKWRPKQRTAASEQRRRRRSGWSGLGRTTFQRVVGLVPRLQGRSEDETIGPGVPRKLAFAVRVRVSRNRSRFFTGRSGARRGPTGLHRHPRVAKYTCVYDVQLLAIWRIPLLAVVLLLSLALRVGLLRRLPTSPCPYTTVWKGACSSWLSLNRYHSSSVA